MKPRRAALIGQKQAFQIYRMNRPICLAALNRLAFLLLGSFSIPAEKHPCELGLKSAIGIYSACGNYDLGCCLAVRFLDLLTKVEEFSSFDPPLRSKRDCCLEDPSFARMD